MLQTVLFIGCPFGRCDTILYLWLLNSRLMIYHTFQCISLPLLPPPLKITLKIIIHNPGCINVSDLDCYVIIRKLLAAVFNILPLFIQMGITSVLLQYTRWHSGYVLTVQQHYVCTVVWNFINILYCYHYFYCGASIASGFVQNGQGLIPDRCKLGCGVCPTSYPVGTGGDFPMELITHLHLVLWSRVV
jgi:hypothetical protein